jgi:endonuclease/exonuclease/phosphatase family metal-dependent hydrolase
MRIRVLTFNVRNTQGPPKRLALINRELQRISPDVVAFQEVVRSEENDSLEQLLEGLGLHGVHQADLQFVPPPFAAEFGGTALASRWPCQIAEAVDMRFADAPDIPWATLAAIIDLPEVGPFLFIATTAAWRAEASAARERQAVTLADLDARHRQELPSVIAGDFNAEPDAASIRFITGKQALDDRSAFYLDAWSTEGEGPGHTWISDNPAAAFEGARIFGDQRFARRLDYVFVGAPAAHPHGLARVISAQLAFAEPLDGVWASDHFGVVIDLEFERRS